jgi:hypothetical protein
MTRNGKNDSINCLGIAIDDVPTRVSLDDTGMHVADGGGADGALKRRLHVAGRKGTQVATRSVATAVAMGPGKALKFCSQQGAITSLGIQSQELVEECP